MTPIAKPTAGSTLLTPNDHTLVMIDFQSQMAFATHSIDAITLRSNAGLVASKQAIRLYDVARERAICERNAQ